MRSYGNTRTHQNEEGKQLARCLFVVCAKLWFYVDSGARGEISANQKPISFKLEVSKHFIKKKSGHY